MPYGFDQNISIVRDDDPNIGVLAKYDDLMPILIIRLREHESSCTPTCSTYTAGLALNRLLADERLCDRKRKLPFADSIITREKQRIGQPP